MIEDLQTPGWVVVTLPKRSDRLTLLFGYVPETDVLLVESSETGDTLVFRDGRQSEFLIAKRIELEEDVSAFVLRVSEYFRRHPDVSGVELERLDQT
jgi:hypothetical protein